jgi:hypothetical protein
MKSTPRSNTQEDCLGICGVPSQIGENTNEIVKKIGGIKRSQINLNNYTPISLLPIFNRLLEQLCTKD